VHNNYSLTSCWPNICQCFNSSNSNSIRLYSYVHTPKFTNIYGRNLQASLWRSHFVQSVSAGLSNKGKDCRRVRRPVWLAARLGIHINMAVISWALIITMMMTIVINNAITFIIYHAVATDKTVLLHTPNISE